MISLRESNIRSSDGYLLIFSLDNLTTFKDLIPILNDIKRVKDNDNISNLPIMLCGNKLDLGYES